ncbi:chemotaxis response regulator protein-glutamate methylesterase [bacterium (Candidatus Blackallbacteria) CG17_big_fil_post_rev_8_21_14_2_50_48_46]|uniref:Protein-glutamate methylesterase/protein-glutamine glutaminase n=1 Tax=bacterium (Candidatus Blackallbacteria) CG17_big_fil_post_rev_8_21_14_2_50_48_46 TaxID=2014261 RepID=A0A2M7FYP3_9BACT|nr:MAG: chemotaxis response regulator protein-glutamate methylesterase [bacterium (Candidatus Blackallbacteria) CG18_big_fil_WC_8_21_14_2_50_49_26]PIW13886.1 MAG: chemotaxis response regulator protein-glutamate methylesterase [bacterium (Candidatus Blackallbacteria) CG17_big_fil_post_rev_8_21_14_2_50_48_46]PIW45112.1 MAG: chemotaxis response regulator protein-glutamate methylesterase [bacterium (Candidatus Blackallbacteria) CG13_big_fil_rev_8_21_14_2_50_49_14]
MLLIRILVVDDSVVNRQMLKKILSTVQEFEVVAVVSNGKLALDRIPQLNPDIVILDIEMPEMNGLETLARIRQQYDKLPVIMFSALTETGASVTIQALSMGANDYVTKPSMSAQHNQEELSSYILEAFVPRIRSLYQKYKPKLPSAVQHAPLREPVAERPTFAVKKVLQRVDIVGIGISTGGPNALAQLFPHFPEDFAVPILVVQHMPPLFTRYLAERLDGLSQIRVVEAEENMLLEPRTAYIAPGNYHMLLQTREGSPCISLNQDPPENSCRPAVDVLFRSIAMTFGSSCLGVVMTGMGQDGLRGCEQISAAGGQILTQDEASSTIWGMPGYVARSGLADKILPLDALGPEIVKRVRFRR